jgi:hypothetical protein
VLAGALVLADLLRAGAGLNPMVTSSFHRLSTEAAALAAQLRRDDARVFTCDLESVPAYFRTRATRAGSQDVWTFSVFMETFTPYFNVPHAVRSGLTLDKTMLVPTDRVLSPDDAACSAVPRVIERLRAGAVSHVLSIAPLDHPDLVLVQRIQNERLAPLALGVYALRGARPRLSVEWDTRPADGLAAPGPEALTTILSRVERPDAIDVRLRAQAPGLLVVRDAFAPGWSATVNGEPAPVLRAEERHRAIPIPAGVSEVRLFYRPPGMALPLALGATALAVALGLLRRRE